MKVFGLIIALLLSISCRGGSIKVDYKSIIDKKVREDIEKEKEMEQ